MDELDTLTFGARIYFDEVYAGSNPYDAQVFFTPAFAAYIELSQFDADDATGEDEDTVTLGARARF